MIHERECAHCGTLAQWRSVDPVPSKCLSCGAPPRLPTHAQEAPCSLNMRLDILYGYMSLRPACASLITTGAYNDEPGKTLKIRMPNRYTIRRGA